MTSGVAQLCLKWNNFEASIIQVFQEMFETENLVDVTIACEKMSLKAHKVVLAACSPYFQSLFMSNPCKHPIVILEGVRFHDLKLLVEFMYRGEVTVSHDQLPSLLKTAETLQIKQLAQMTTHSGNFETQSTVAAAGRKKRKRPRVKRLVSGAGDVVSGESDTESPAKQMAINPQSDYQNENMSNENEEGIDGETAGSTRILELSMAEVVDQNVDVDTDSMTRNLDGTEVATLSLPADGEEYEEEKFEQTTNVTRVLPVYTTSTSEEQTLILMRKKQSFVWDYFTETHKGSVKCNDCKKLLSYKDTSGSTSNMIKHLKTVHSIERAPRPPLQE